MRQRNPIFAVAFAAGLSLTGCAAQHKGASLSATAPEEQDILLNRLQPLKAVKERLEGDSAELKAAQDKIPEKVGISELDTALDIVNAVLHVTDKMDLDRLRMSSCAETLCADLRADDSEPTWRASWHAIVDSKEIACRLAPAIAHQHELESGTARLNAEAISAVLNEKKEAIKKLRPALGLNSNPR